MQLILYNLRKNKNKMSQKDVAKVLGISLKAYGAKERGEKEFTQDEMFKLSEYFKKPMDDIFFAS